MSKSEQRAAIEELIYRSCLALDARDYKTFLGLCEPEFRYTVTTHSPEIRSQNTSSTTRAARRIPR